ncbi:tyrosine-type recombinase/integrase [uncultured Anaerolinea sp.]|uniref:tyrosine-type recombinase/integrase n=1 Tax=uncultured Anaerolinea sp. TaxID=430695 RepID=UPI00262CAE39|nr:tyrosine-type recombinase/integrase [uncultured Anaerolinea sp.]
MSVTQFKIHNSGKRVAIDLNLERFFGRNKNMPLTEAYDDFILSRKAMNCSAKTIQTYTCVLGRFVRWLNNHGIQSVSQVTNRHVRQFLSEVQGKPWTLNGYGRAIRTLVRFWYREGYLSKSIEVPVPSVPKQKLPVLSTDQIRTILSVCTLKERVIFTFMLDSGLRRQEVCNLNIGDINLRTGVIRVVQGKGKKDRIAVIGMNTQKLMSEYLKKLPCVSEDTPLFTSALGERFTGDGLQSFFERLSKKVGFKVTAHMVRRTFATLCLRLGMDMVSLQTLLGHSSLETTRRYIQLIEDDLLEAHRKSSPIDRLRLE